MRFSQQLRTEASPLFEAIKQHPFVLGIGQASLQTNQLVHYVQQDFQYLNTYVRVYGLGISKCRTREDMRRFYNRIGFVLNDEVHPHVNMCRVAGVDYSDLQQQTRLCPTAHHYASHMLSTAQSGTLGEILAALLPCLWTYVEIGESLTESAAPTLSHPFHDWITFYNTPSMHDNLRETLAWLDSYAEQAGEWELQSMRKAFMDSCDMELRFFEMAYTCETW